MTLDEVIQSTTEQLAAVGLARVEDMAVGEHVGCSERKADCVWP
jgi:hypothetical protein